MPLSWEDPRFRCYALAVVSLAANLIATTQFTGCVRVMTGNYLAAEDYVCTNVPPVRAVQEFSTPVLQRLAQMHRNGVENIPVFLSLALVYVASEPPLLESQILFALYCASRYVFSAAYFYGVQPLRTNVFIAGILVMLYMMGRVLESMLAPESSWAGLSVRFVFMVPMVCQSLYYDVKIAQNKAKQKPPASCAEKRWFVPHEATTRVSNE